MSPILRPAVCAASYLYQALSVTSIGVTHTLRATRVHMELGQNTRNWVTFNLRRQGSGTKGLYSQKIVDLPANYAILG